MATNASEGRDNVSSSSAEVAAVDAALDEWRGIFGRVCIGILLLIKPAQMGGTQRLGVRSEVIWWKEGE